MTILNVTFQHLARREAESVALSSRDPLLTVADTRTRHLDVPRENHVVRFLNDPSLASDVVFKDSSSKHVLLLEFGGYSGGAQNNFSARGESEQNRKNFVNTSRVLREFE